MSLDFYLERVQLTEVFWANITHNLNSMASEAGIYDLLWHPKEGQTGADMIAPLEKAIAEMKASPARFEKHNAENGWGLYKHFVPWLEKVLEACREYPDAAARASR